MDKKNLVYVAVYGNKDYVKLFNLLFASLILSKTDRSGFSLLVMTAPSLKDDIIKTIASIDLGVELLVWANEEKPETFEAAFARYHIFAFQQIDQFERILYLDTDVLINGALSEIFHNNLSDGTIYCLPEGELISDDKDYYGRSLFIEQGLEQCLIERGFTSGAILFKNSPVVRSTFQEVLKLGSENRKNGLVFSSFGQPFLNLLATSRNLINLELLPNYMVNNPVNATGSFTINHFPGGPGNFGSKFSKMSKFFLGMIRQRLPEHLWSIVREGLFSIEGVKNKTIKLEKNIFLAELSDKTAGFLLASSASSTGLFVVVPSFEVSPIRFSEDIKQLQIPEASKKVLNDDFSASNIVSSHRARIQNLVANFHQHSIAYGPFKGFKFDPVSSWGNDRGSMILGIYEQEVLESLEQISSRYKNFINIGAADGYYGIGVLVNNIFNKSYCFEISNNGREVIAKNAALNNVSDKVVIKGEARKDFYDEIPSEDLKNSVLLVDIEGGEFDILDKKAFETLSDSVIFIELHHQFFRDGRNKLNKLISDATGTHLINMLTMSNRNLSKFNELHSLNDTDRWMLCDEGRPCLMWWLRLDPIEKT